MFPFKILTSKADEYITWYDRHESVWWLLLHSWFDSVYDWLLSETFASDVQKVLPVLGY